MGQTNLLYFRRPSYIGAQAYNMCCPSCLGEDGNATTWVVRALEGGKATGPDITELVCPSCDLSYRVFAGKIKDTTPKQLRSSIDYFWPLLALVYGCAIYGAVMLWRMHA